MYMDMNMVRGMLMNIDTIMKESAKGSYSCKLLTKYNNAKYFEAVLRTIKDYDETNFHKDVSRIALINYKKYTFIFGMSYYSTGKAVVLIKLPIDKEPAVITISANLDVSLYEICYSVAENVSRLYFNDCEDMDFNIDETMSKFSKWNNNKVLNKGLHENKPRIQEDEEFKISSDDDVMNMIDEYAQYCEQFYEINDNRFEMLIENVKTFDVGTVNTLDQLTNLVRFMYYEYEFNENLHVYSNPIDGEEDLIEKCGMKFYLRHLDVLLENALDEYLYENGDEMVVDTFIDLFEPVVENLKVGYGIDVGLKMYYDSGELGLFDTGNDVLLYQKNISNLVSSIRLENDDKYKKSFYSYDQTMKLFFMRLIEETNFIDLFLGIVFTDPMLLKGLIENTTTDESNDESDNFF